MLRIGKLADYALLIVDCLAKEAGQLTTDGIYGSTGVPLHTVRKLLKLLVDAEILRSQRGARGGNRLAIGDASISDMDRLEVGQFTTRLTHCVDSVSTHVQLSEYN